LHGKQGVKSGENKSIKSQQYLLVQDIQPYRITVAPTEAPEDIIIIR
jgi:hypothetical protein